MSKGTIGDAANSMKNSKAMAAAMGAAEIAVIALVFSDLTSSLLGPAGDQHRVPVALAATAILAAGAATGMQWFYAQAAQDGLDAASDEPLSKAADQVRMWVKLEWLARFLSLILLVAAATSYLVGLWSWV